MRRPRRKVDQKIKRTFQDIVYASIYEAVIAENLARLKVKVDYEPDKFTYVKPSTTHTYTPDFRIKTKTGKIIYIEAKGYLDEDNRKKMILVKECNPQLDVRFLFQSDNPTRKGSRTYYSDWAKKNGFKYSLGYLIPKEWLDE